MQHNNFTSSKNTKNGQLLTLLTNRSRAKSVPNLKNDWPGLFNPNFATNIKLRSSSNNNQSLKRSNTQFTLKPSLIPITPVTITHDLQFKPDFSNKITFKRQLSRQSGGFSTSKTSRNKVSVIRIQQNQDPMTKSTIFRNSTINNKVNQIIEQQTYFTARVNAKQNIANIINQKTFLDPPNLNKTQKSFKSKEKSKKEEKNKNQFKVDFFAFGYIEKVIDNPQLWNKYVHKIKQNQKTSPLITQLNPITFDQ